MPGRRPGVNLSRQVASQLRELIRTGEWPPEYIVPPQHELGTTYGVSSDTARHAVQLLKEEGLLKGGQGKRPVVADREPVHALALNPLAADAGDPTELVSEPPVPFVQSQGTGKATRRWTQGTVTVPLSVAMLLDLHPEAGMAERTMLLIIDREPVLTSTSYLPIELTGDGAGWQGAEVGQLALAGHPVTAEPARAWSRMPTPEEVETLGMDRGVPVMVVPYPYRVIVDDERTLRAGVIVTARSDRVFVR